MNIKHQPLRAAMVLGVLLVLGPLSTARAQTVDEAPAASAVSELPRVVVSESSPESSATTLSKLPLTPREIPQSVNIISRELMDQQNIRTMEEAMLQTPGVVVQPNVSITTAYYVRGLQVDSYAFDGVPVVLGGTAEAPQDMSIYEHIELLRGANGLMQGAGNPAATINLVRKRPQHEFAASAALTLGSWNQKRGEVDIGSPLNTAGTARGRLVAAWEERDFFYDRAERETKVLYGITEFDITPDTLLSTGFQYQSIHSAADMAGVPMAPDGTSLDLPRTTYLDADWGQFNWTTRRAFFALEQRLAHGWKTRLSGEYQKMDAFLKYAAPFGAIDPATGDGAMLMGGAHTFHNDNRSVDLHMQGPLKLFGRTHDLLFGLSDSNAAGDQSNAALLPGVVGLPVNIYQWNPSSIPEPGITAYQLGSETDTTQKGIYALGRFALNDSLTLALGGRMSWWDQRTLTARFNPARQFTPYGGLILDFSQNWSAYVSYADVFKPQTQLTFDGSPLNPVKGKTWETGIKGELAEGILNVSAAIFRTDLDNNAQLDPNYPCMGQNCWYINGGKVRSQGFELTGTGYITPFWSVSTGYTFNTTKYVQDSTQSGQYATFNPKHLLRVWTNYDLPWQENRWSIGGGVQVQSEYHWRSGGITLHQGGYALANLRLGYRINPHWTVALNANNLFDRKYYQKFFGTAWSNRYGQPANVAFTVRGHY